MCGQLRIRALEPVRQFAHHGERHLWKLGEKLENPIVTKQDSDSPLMRHVRLDNVILPEAKQLTPAPGAKPRLGPDQQAQLVALLLEGAEAFAKCLAPETEYASGRLW